MCGWMPIETAPKNQGAFESWGPMVLVANSEHVQEAWFEEGVWRSHREYGEWLEEIAVPIPFQPTHWQHKPEPPHGL